MRTQRSAFTTFIRVGESRRVWARKCSPLADREHNGLLSAVPKESGRRRRKALRQIGIERRRWSDYLLRPRGFTGGSDLALRKPRTVPEPNANLRPGGSLRTGYGQPRLRARGASRAMQNQVDTRLSRPPRVKVACLCACTRMLVKHKVTVHARGREGDRSMFSAIVFDAKTPELAEKWTSPRPWG